MFVGAAGTIGAALVANGVPAFAAAKSGGLTQGDAAILRFLAAAEILETDFWQQYNELGGIQDSEVPGGSGNAVYTKAVLVPRLGLHQVLGYFTMIVAIIDA